MVTYEISAKNEQGELYVLADYNPHLKPRKATWQKCGSPKWGTFKVVSKIQNYMTKHMSTLQELATKQGLDPETIHMLRIDFPAALG